MRREDVFTMPPDGRNCPAALMYRVSSASKVMVEKRSRILRPSAPDSNELSQDQLAPSVVSVSRRILGTLNS